MKKTIIFDERSPKWEKGKNKLVNEWVVKSYECRLNDWLRRNGCLLLRDVYEALGIPLSRESFVAGWRSNSVTQFTFKLHPKANGVIEIVLPDMESDIRYAFPSEEES